MEQRQQQIICVDEFRSSNEQPIGVYLFPLNRPIIVPADTICHATLLQARIQRYIGPSSSPVITEDNDLAEAEAHFPCRLNIRGLGIDDSLVQRHLMRPADTSFVCLLPSSHGLDLAGDITMMPPRAGIYHRFEIWVSTDDKHKRVIPLTRLFLTIRLCCHP